MDDATGFLAEFQGAFWASQIFQNRFRAWTSSEFFHYYLDFAHSLFIYQDYILCNSFNCEVNFRFRLLLNSWPISPLQETGGGWLWVMCRVALISSLLSSHPPHQLPGARRRTLRGVLLLLPLRLPSLKYNLRCGTRRRESLEWSSFSFLRNHFIDAICRHRIVHNHGIGPCLPES